MLFLQHTHYPQYAGTRAAGHSLRGPFGDALFEFDSTIGNLITTLEKMGVINNTLVFFTADNGLVGCSCKEMKKSRDVKDMYLFCRYFDNNTEVPVLFLLLCLKNATHYCSKSF